MSTSSLQIAVIRCVSVCIYVCAFVNVSNDRSSSGRDSTVNG